jgi:hypothetical protein
MANLLRLLAKDPRRLSELEERRARKRPVARANARVVRRRRT